MLTPASLDLGSVMGDTTYEGPSYRFKVYPRLVHAINPFTSSLQGDIPQRVHGVMTKAIAALEIIHFLCTVHAMEKGGFRIELTLGAPTLAAARDMVSSNPLLDWACWMNQPDEHAAYRLKATVVTKDGLLANADWVHHQATAAAIFQANNNARPAKAQVQAMTLCWPH